MFKNLVTPVFAIVLTLSCGLVMAEDACTEPEAPTIPNRDDMTESELISLVSEVKSFNTVNEAYRLCVSKRAEELATVATPEQQELWVIQYNNSVDLEHTLADNLNAKIRAYKASHK